MTSLPSHARAAPHPRNAHADASADPDRMAFVACAQGQDADGAELGALVLCWPTVPQAWLGIGHTLRTIAAERGRTLPGAPLPERASWLRDCAPQLAAPFQRTALAEETSVAALIARTPMRVAVAVSGVGAARTAAARPHGARFDDCLASFEREARAGLQRRCTRAISAAQPAPVQAEYRQSLQTARERAPGSALLRELRLDFWPGGTEPLPLELAKAVAAAVLRRLQSRDEADAVFDAAQAKFANDPFPRAWETARPRRRSRSG
ncbi:hypothetical protein [Lysobacter enzymogenes]|uniref:Uncharacterized protein n=1 Tax=Lysobacter enzymogenes TaxID=69 RepID=A0A3N2RCZ9_LYSEN|nr:hypothetical protein [Lysobacter enzymogenes]ROU05246.1 hypothetical protein D9T17_19155 [Lysobacter enzymogenes]